jgi:hypothetical protein
VTGYPTISSNRRVAQAPGPLGLALFALVALALSAVVLVHQEDVYEHDPQLRARAGLVNAGSDISLMRARNFRGVLDIISARVDAGGVIRGLSVTPSKVGVTLLSASGAETDLTITPGLHVDTLKTGNRVSDHRGVPATAIAATAPARILAGGLRRFGLRAAEFERLELDIPSGPNPAGWAATWTQPTDDDGIVAALDGSDVRRPFTPARDAG